MKDYVSILEDAPPRVRKILMLRPVRNDKGLKWRVKNGRVIITHKKNFTGFERFLFKIFGGSEIIRKHLDDMGSDIWLMCDGNHTIYDICDYMYNKYKERIEPVYGRVIKFMEELAKRNYIYFERVKYEDKRHEEE